MTRTTNPLHLLTADLEARSASPAGRRALDRIRDAGVDVGATVSMAELVARCHDPAADGQTHAIVDGLLAAAPTDPDAAVCALVALRPALLRIARRVCGGDPDDDELAEVVAIAWEEICGAAGSLGATHVVRATWTRSRSVLRRRSGRVAREAQLDEGSEALDSGPPAHDEGEATLAASIAERIISKQDALLIALTRLGGVTMTELAQQRGVPVATLTSRRRRAEAAIRRHLSEQERG